MIKGLMIILLAAMLGAAVSAVFQHAARRRFDVIPYCALIAMFQVVGAALTARWGVLRQAGFDEFLALAGMMAACGLVNGLGMIANIQSMRRGHAAISNALAQAALLIPFVFSILVWNEHASALNLVGIAGVTIMIFLVATGGASRENKQGSFAAWLFFILLAFICYGFAQLTYLAPSRWTGNADLLGFRPLFMILAQAILFAVTALAARQTITRAMTPSALAGAAVGLGYLYAVALAADAMSAVNLAGIVYPLVIGGGLILFVLYSRIFLREAYTARSWLGLAAGVAGIVLICFR